MVVVADTSPINYLVLIGQIDLLIRLYTRILIPPAVLAELKHPLAPKPVRDWACDTPKWLEVLSPKDSLTLAQLDLGETEAIALATEMHAEVLLIDEQAGRQEAVRRGLRVSARSPCSMKPIRPGSSVSTRRLLSYGKPLFACPKPSSPKSCKSDLADPAIFA